MSAEEQTLVGTALGSEDEAERHAASRRLAELNRDALKRIKRLRVVVTTYSPADDRAQLSLPINTKRLLALSGVVLIDADRGRADAVLRIYASRVRKGEKYAPWGIGTGTFVYSGAEVGGALVLDMDHGTVVYVSTFFQDIPAPIFLEQSAPSGEPPDRALGWALLSPLAALLNADAVQLLLDLRRDRDPHLDRLVAQVLCEIRDPRTIDRLVVATKESHTDGRRVAAEALCKLRDRRGLETTLAALNDKAVADREVAADALGELGDPRSSAGLITTLKEPEWGGLCEAAVRALSKIGDPRSFETLLPALTDANYCARMAAARALGLLGDARALDPLLAVALTDEHAFVREAAGRALHDLKDSRALNRLVAAATDPSLLMRPVGFHSAVEALAQMKEPSVAELLIPDLRSDNALIREKMAEALGEIGNPRAVEPLITALKGDRDEITREYAAEALGKLGDRRAAEPLIAALRDQSPDVRQKAASALGKLRDTRAVSPLIEALSDKWISNAVSPISANTVRHAAAKSLGELNDPRALDPLRSFLKKECSPGAVTALVRLELHSRLAGGR